MKFTIAISETRNPLSTNYWLWFFMIAFTIVWTITLIGTTDINNWLLENTLTALFILF